GSAVANNQAGIANKDRGPSFGTKASSCTRTKEPVDEASNRSSTHVGCCAGRALAVWLRCPRSAGEAGEGTAPSRPTAFRRQGQGLKRNAQVPRLRGRVKDHPRLFGRRDRPDEQRQERHFRLV